MFADIAEEEVLVCAVPSPKSTCTSAAGSGTIMRSPPVPNGVSKIGPKQTCIRLEWVQPMPVFARARQLARREALAAHEPRDVAGADEDELLAQHCDPSGFARKMSHTLGRSNYQFGPTAQAR